MGIFGWFLIVSGISIISFIFSVIYMTFIWYKRSQEIVEIMHGTL